MNKRDTVRGQPGLDYGRIRFLNLAATWTAVLCEARDNRLPDQWILEEIAREFPHKNTWRINNLRVARSRFNRGREGYGYGQPLQDDDPRRSIPFGDDGQPINIRGNPHWKR